MKTITKNFPNKNWILQNIFVLKTDNLELENIKKEIGFDTKNIQSSDNLSELDYPDNLQTNITMDLENKKTSKNSSTKNLKVAIVHDYLHQYGGAEKVVEQWLEIFPKADIYTSFSVPERFKSSELFSLAFEENRVFNSVGQKFINNNLPKFKYFYWLYPVLMSFVKVSNYDLVLISSTYCGKNIKLENNKTIFHYCHSPVRFLYGLVTETDHQSLKWYLRFIIPFINFFLKILDQGAARYLNKKGTIWIANSKYIKDLVDSIYSVNSKVVYPPIKVTSFKKLLPQRKVLRQLIKEKQLPEFYLCHSRISFHKRLDLAILACLELGYNLKISGAAALDMELKFLQKIVYDWKQKNPDKPSNIEFLGRTTDQEYYELLKNCKAFIFPGKEDFGITPPEVIAAGVPVIALGQGGALEYVKYGLNGVLFDNQSVLDLIEAIKTFEKKEIWNMDLVSDSVNHLDAKVFDEYFLLNSAPL